MIIPHIAIYWTKLTNYSGYACRFNTRVYCLGSIKERDCEKEKEVLGIVIGM